MADTTISQLNTISTLSANNFIPISDGTTTTKLGTDSLFGFRNRIINGAFNIWQRGTSFVTGASIYSADRWIGFTPINNTTSTFTRDSDVPQGFKYSIKCIGTVADIVQRIESANSYDLVGKSVTVSFWLKQTVASGNNSITVVLQHPNTADEWTAPIIVIESKTISANSSWNRYTVTFNNLPNGVANGLCVDIYSSSTVSSSTFFVTGVQLEAGSSATPFEFRPIGTELALCQRYYYRIKGEGVNPLNYTIGIALPVTATTAAVYTTFPVTLRTDPLALEQSGTAADYGIAPASGNIPCSVVPAFNNTTSKYTAQTMFKVADGLTPNQLNVARFLSTNAYLAWSVEL